ncbi:hypothetical protein [Planctopirus hydrillae]|uniref:Uncharacterized protein n=1 Tax=Planctopirus hydrillae TaxID=1841610 RepID=A0A1C3EHI3_9PLAN|nr:hypothetical protein [Planctopirus hydrillae]ODA32701.1 hypothetical protein A6X21_20355 [Planctopirus hydrillae]
MAQRSVIKLPVLDENSILSATSDFMHSLREYRTLCKHENLPKAILIEQMNANTLMLVNSGINLRIGWRSLQSHRHFSRMQIWALA